MEQNTPTENNTPQVETYCGVPIKPDKAEKKEIRKKYTRAGLVILLNMVLFNIVLMGIIYLIGGVYAGDTSSFKALQNGLSKLWTDHPAIHTLMSCGVPIISEICAILFGIKLLKLDLKPLFNRNNYGGGEVVKVCSICLGLQTISALVVVIGDLFLNGLGYKSETVALDATEGSVAATLFMYFYACLLGPVLEELLYRGVLLQGLRKYNERFAVIISALIFGLMHQNYQQFVLGFTLGLILAAVTLRTGSIIPSIITHIIVNTTATLSALAMQAADYGAYLDSVSGNIDIAGMSPAFIIVLIFNALFRYGFMFIAIILLIISMVKKVGVRKPTPAGKTRGWPVIATSWVWYVILAAYIYLGFFANLVPIE